jgi:hypothetical protein
MEYLLAHFSRSRRVVIDDIFSGRTEEIIELEAGAHIVALGPPFNFTPSSIKIVLRDTSPLTPMEVTFDPA